MGSRFVGPRRLVPAPLRAHLTRGGDAKVRYSKADAKAMAERLGKDCYRCDVCGHWHVGGKAPRRHGR